MNGPSQSLSHSQSCSMLVTWLKDSKPSITNKNFKYKLRIVLHILGFRGLAKTPMISAGLTKTLALDPGAIRLHKPRLSVREEQTALAALSQVENQMVPPTEDPTHTHQGSFT